MYFNNYLSEKDFIEIPPSWCPSNFYTFTFEGWGPATFQIDDPTLTEIFHMAARATDFFIRMYKETRVFSTPQITWRPEGIVHVRIGTLDKEIYERRIEKEKEKL